MAKRYVELIDGVLHVVTIIGRKRPLTFMERVLYFLFGMVPVSMRTKSEKRKKK